MLKALFLFFSIKRFYMCTTWEIEPDSRNCNAHYHAQPTFPIAFTLRQSKTHSHLRSNSPSSCVKLIQWMNLNITLHILRRNILRQENYSSVNSSPRMSEIFFAGAFFVRKFCVGKFCFFALAEISSPDHSSPRNCFRLGEKSSS
jgi:hypothetical protein